MEWGERVITTLREQITIFQINGHKSYYSVYYFGWVVDIKVIKEKYMERMERGSERRERVGGVAGEGIEGKKEKGEREQRKWPV